MARHEILEGAPPEPYGETLEPAPAADNTSSALTVHLLPTLPPLRFGDLVATALRHHADLGDVQVHPLMVLKASVTTRHGDTQKSLQIADNIIRVHKFR